MTPCWSLITSSSLPIQPISQFQRIWRRCFVPLRK